MSHCNGLCCDNKKRCQTATVRVMMKIFPHRKSNTNECVQKPERSRYHTKPRCDTVMVRVVIQMSQEPGSRYDENLPASDQHNLEGRDIPQRTAERCGHPPASDQLSLQRKDIPLRPAGRCGGQGVPFRYHVLP